MKNAALLLSSRTLNALKWHIWNTHSETIAKRWRNNPTPKVVAQYNSEDLMRLPNFGAVSLGETIAWLDEYGMKLADNPQGILCPHCGQYMKTRAGSK